MKLDPYLKPFFKKISSKCIKHLNMSQHYKKIEINHYNLEFEIDFRNDNKQQKDDTLDICALNGSITNVKKTMCRMRKLFASHVSDNIFITTKITK